MGFSAVAAVVAAVGSAYNADQQRKAAKEQAGQMAEASRRAAEQAAESARANALAEQTARQREAVQAGADVNLALASEKTTPTVELAAEGGAEAARRRTVRATFNPGDEEGSIRV